MTDNRLVPPVLDAVTPLPLLPFSVYFVTKELDKWDDLWEVAGLPDGLNELFARSTSGNDLWAVQTYLQLKRRGLNVFLVSQYVPGQICIAPNHNLATKDFCYRSYVVGCRLDSERPELCDQQTVLNQQCVHSSIDHFMMQWPLPGIKPRDPARGTTVEARGTTVEVVDFKDDVRFNLAEPF